MSSYSKNPRESRRARPLLGTIVEITARGASERVLTTGMDAAFRAIEVVQSLLSYHDVSSELSLLNREAADRFVPVSRSTREVLLLAQRIHRESGGCFDPVIAPLLEKSGHLPRPASAQRVSRRARFSDVILSPRDGVHYARSLRIDLGGVAKGFAVDRAIDALQQSGVPAGLVNAGGDLRVFGDTSWPILTRDPVMPGQLRMIGHVRDSAVATSATYFSRRRTSTGKWTSAIIDPKSRRPWLARTSVTVRASNAAVADALTKVVALKGLLGAKSVLASFGAEAWLLSRDGWIQSAEPTLCAA